MNYAKAQLELKEKYPPLKLVGYSSDDLITNYRKKINKSHYLRSCQSGICCYCEITLTNFNHKINSHKTKDHLIPKSRGGKITAPCCFECNKEKANLTLCEYIQLLNLKMLEVTGDDLKKLQTKISNANRLAKEIEKL